MDAVMKHTAILPILFALAPVGLSLTSVRAEKETENIEISAEAKVKSEQSIPISLDEARGRARWIHELVHGSLQVMHRDFFGDGDDDALSLPSQSLDDVFDEMRRSWDVDIRWLGVNATRGKDHEPQDRFEEAAAKALEAGAEEYEGEERGRYRFVGVVHIKNECLKCHDRNRTTVDEKVAGLAISLPLQKKEDSAREAKTLKPGK